MVESLISAGDKVEMRSIVPVILPDGTEGRKLYKSTVYDVEENGNVEILMPMEQTKLVLLPLDAEYETFFFTNSGVFKGNIRIVDREKAGNMYLFIAELISNLSKHQRREFYRFNTILETDIQAVSEEQAQTIGKGLAHLVNLNDKSHAVIVDISGGGTRFVSRKPEKVDSIIYMNFKLNMPDGQPPKEFEVASRVIVCNEIPNRKNEYELRTKFVYMDNTTREDIIKYIFNEERKNRKNGKGR